MAPLSRCVRTALLALAAGVPLLMRASHPRIGWVLQTRFGITWDPARSRELHAAGQAARQALIQGLGGEAAYWADHLRCARTEIALVNQLEPLGALGASLRWVPPDELALALRTCLLAAPERTLFGTDAYGCFQIPVGPEGTHLAFSPILRQALTEALASLVEGELRDEARALQVGRGVLGANARRLYGWGPAPQGP